MKKVAFLGSSTLDFGFGKYEGDIKQILEFLFEFDKELVIITGGYQGIMKSVTEISKALVEDNRDKGYQVTIGGILFDGYRNDPNSAESDLNAPNEDNEFQISSPSIGLRVQNLLELSDLVVALPGRSGTLQEILQFIEHTKYGEDYKNEKNLKRLILHRYWRADRLEALNKMGIIESSVYEHLQFWHSSRSNQIARSVSWALHDRRRTPNRFTQERNKIPVKIRPTRKETSPAEWESLRMVLSEINFFIEGQYPSGQNRIIGLDVIIGDRKSNQILSLKSLSTGEYLNALDEFLHSHSSVLGNTAYLHQNIDRFEYFEIGSFESGKDSNSLNYHDFSADGSITPNQGRTTVQDWEDFLKQKAVGKSFVWRVLPVQMERYVISAFVCFDLFLPSPVQNEVNLALSLHLYNHTLQELHRRLDREKLERATKAAISQVMARNMSHNIGSHVLSKFKDERDLNALWGMDLRSVVEYSATQRGEAGLSAEDSLVAEHEENTTGNRSGDEVGEHGAADEQPAIASGGESGNEPGDEINGKATYETLKQYTESHDEFYSDYELLPSAQVAYFNEYLKNRMDFLADIATADPAMENAMFLYADVFKGFDRNRILLNRISGLAGSNFNFSIKLKRVLNGQCKELKDYDVSVSMTNDILGAQAFYVILENLIRNIAKHAKADEISGNGVELTVCIADYPTCNSYYEISVFDNLWRDEDKIREVVCSRNNAFNRSILEKQDHRLRPNDLGTIEMDVCAAYMQRVPIIEVENDRYRLLFNGMDYNDFQQLNEDAKSRINNTPRGEVVNCGLVPGENRDGRNTNYPKLMFAYAHPKDPNETTEDAEFSLGYKFYLRKPQEVLILSESPDMFPEIPNGSGGNLKPEEMVPLGITLVTYDDLFSKEEVLNHELVYLQTPVPEEKKDEFEKRRKWLPQRIVKVIEEASFEDPADFIRQVWEKYAVTEFLTKKKVYLEGRHIISAEDDKLVILEPEMDNESGDLTLNSATIPNEDVFRVYIDNHHFNWQKECFSNTDCKKEHFLTSKDGPTSGERIYPHKWDYYDMRCSHSAIDRSDLNWALNEKNLDENVEGEYAGRFVCPYIETVSSKVVIMDERIQENMASAEKKKRRHYSGEVDLYEYFRRQNVIIPLMGHQTEPNLNESNFGTLGKIGCPKEDLSKMSQADKIKCFIKDHIGDSKFVIIHLGIIEKLLPSGATKNDTAINDVLKDLLSNGSEVDDSLKRKVVITSGRGQPTNIPDGYLYVPLAPIQNAIETVFDKFVLTRVLYNARGIRK